MPVKSFLVDDEYCVYEIGEDGGHVGDSLGCHDTKSDADAQSRAINANIENKGIDDIPNYRQSDGDEYCGNCYHYDREESYCKIFNATVMREWTCDAWRPIITGQGGDMYDGEYEKSFSVFKDKSGKMRWLSISSSSYEDRDGEIVSIKALRADVKRTDKDGDYGPLRWWHMGKPDITKKIAGKGVDLGTCDFSMVHGKMLIESGLFDDPDIAQSVKENADNLRVSIAFFHPENEPDREGVFHNIRRFERSIMPKGFESNPFTSFMVKETSMTDEQKKDKLNELVGGSKASTLLSNVDDMQTQADSKGIKNKEGGWLSQFKSVFGIRDDNQNPTEKEAKIKSALDALVDAVGQTDKAEDSDRLAEITVGDLRDVMVDVMRSVIGDMMGEMKAGDSMEKSLKTTQSSIETRIDAVEKGTGEIKEAIQIIGSHLSDLSGFDGYRATKQPKQKDHSANGLQPDMSGLEDFKARIGSGR